MSAIQNFGLLWEKKYICVGWKTVPGHLKGWRERRKREADFRGQAGVYILYDKDMIPVYVGQAGRGNNTLITRLRNHFDDHIWNRWVYFSWFGLKKVNKDGSLSNKYDNSNSITEVLNDIEGVLILGIEPKLNKQGPTFNGAEQWWQVIDERVVEVNSYHLMQEINSLKAMLEKNRD